MLCRLCQTREVPPRQGEQGRPRTTCLTCVPPPDERRRAQNRAAQERFAARRRRQRETNYATTLCRCGRDYLTVPLEESHVCPRPEPIPEPAGKGIYDPDRYPWR